MLCTKDSAKAAGLNIWVNGDHNNKGPEVDIIAVQGPGAHQYYTWVHLPRFFHKHRAPAQEPSDTPRTTSDRSEVMWLRDLLPNLIPNARIASYSYEFDWQKDVTTNLRNCGEQFLNILHQNRVGDAERQRPLIIIGHSLGGLVVKQALVLANHRDIFRDIKIATAGIIFLGTPHQGSSAAEYDIWLARALGNDTTLLETLKENNSTLLEVAQDFESSYSNADIVCFYEKKDGPLGTQFVDFQSASLNAKRRIYLNTDHSGLNKFFGSNDENFVLVQAEILRISQAAPQTIETRYHSSTFSNQSRWKEAEELGLQVMESRKRVLGSEHPDTLTSIANLASTFSNQSRWKEAEELGLQVMESRKRVLGSEHPDTLTSIANLASTFSNQSRWKEAEELGLQVMESRKRVLGSEHPDTQTSIAHLASTYRNQARWMEAEELEVQVTETRKKVLGLEHLDIDPESALLQLQLMENPSSYGGSTLVDSANLIQIERLAEKQQELESVSNNTQDRWQSSENTQNPELDEIRSLFSDDEDISSQVSIEASSQRAIAERQLAALMAHHPELGMAYDEAMALMPEDRFVANFRRLLKRFYLDIRPLASTRLERTAVELIRSRGARMRLARIIADARNARRTQTEENIRIAHQRDRTETERWIKSIGHDFYEEGEPDEAENTATKSSSSDSESDEKGEFPNIQLVEDFLTGSDAFRTLSHNFGIFVLPRSLSQLALSIPPNQIRFSNYNDISLPNKIKTFMEEHTGAQWNWWPLSPRKQLLSSNQTRMHWQCFCGKHLWTEMSMSQSSIFQRLSENNIAQPSQIPLCSKVQKRGFLTSVAQWITNPNSASRNTQQSTPSGMSTSPSAHIGPATAGPGPITRPLSSALPSPNIVANNQHTTVSSNFRLNNRLWTLLGVHGGRKTLELGQICSDNSGKGFVRKLRETYRNLRGFRRVWFSFWQFSHCDFVKFEKIGKNRIIARCSDLPTGPDYDYFPRPPQADNPPITPHEFNLAFSSCGRYCFFALFHDCYVLEDEQDFALRIPKRKGKFEIENSIRQDPIRFAWGIQAQYTISFLHVITYHLLMMIGPTVFWVWWQKHHPNDLQNASIPLTTAAVLISLFWSATGILRGLREPRQA